MTTTVKIWPQLLNLIFFSLVSSVLPLDFSVSGSSLAPKVAYLSLYKGMTKGNFPWNVFILKWYPQFALPDGAGSINFIQFHTNWTHPSFGNVVDAVAVERTATAPAYCPNLNFAVTFPTEFVMIVLANDKKEKCQTNY